MIQSEKSIVPCFLCGNGTEVKYSKREKPYLICDPCGIQVFVRGKKGIQLLSRLLNSLKEKSIAASGSNNLELTSLANRLTELKALLKKTKEENWLSYLFSEDGDLVGNAIKAEIEKVEERLKSFANMSSLKAK